MSEKEPNIGENGDLLTEPYDNNVKMTKDEDALSAFAGQRQVQVSYNLTAEEVKKGLLVFQKQTVYKRNWIYTILLGIIFVLYLISIIRNPKDGLGLFLCVLSLAVIAFVWLLPFTHRNKMAKSITSITEPFTFTVCEKGLVAGLGADASYIFYENEPVEATKLSDMLIFSISKEKIFVIPHRCMSEADWEEISHLLEEGLGERFVTKD